MLLGLNQKAPAVRLRDTKWGGGLAEAAVFTLRFGEKLAAFAGARLPPQLVMDANLEA